MAQLVKLPQCSFQVFTVKILRWPGTGSDDERLDFHQH